MKYVILLCDGMADNPIESLGGRTPMEAAHNPSMNWLAQTAQVGMVRTVPEGMTPGSDVANLAVLGYDPAEVYTGRSPLEAASISAATRVAHALPMATLMPAKAMVREEGMPTFQNTVK